VTALSITSTRFSGASAALKYAAKTTPITAPPDVLDTAREIAAICAEFGVDLPTAALHFPLRDPAVRAVVAGAATPAEVRQNARRLAAAVPADLWTTLRDKGLIRT